MCCFVAGFGEYFAEFDYYVAEVAAAEVEERQPLRYRVACNSKHTFAWNWEQTIPGHALEETSYVLMGPFVRLACMPYL